MRPQARLRGRRGPRRLGRAPPAAPRSHRRARQPGRPRQLLAGGCARRHRPSPLPAPGGGRGGRAAVSHAPCAPRSQRSPRRARRTGRAARTRPTRWRATSATTQAPPARSPTTDAQSPTTPAARTVPTGSRACRAGLVGGRHSPPAQAQQTNRATVSRYGAVSRSAYDGTSVGGRTSWVHRMRSVL